MIERIAALLTRENWTRWRLGIEIGIAALLWVVAVLNVGYFYSVTVAGASVVLSAAAVATIPLARVLPPVAIAVAGLTGFATVVVSTELGSTVPTVIWLSIAYAIFGCALFGSRTVRIVAIAVAGALVLAATLSGYGTGSGAMLFVFLLSATGLGGAWLIGSLIRTVLDRDRLVEQNTVATTRLVTVESAVTLEQERNRVAREVHDIVAHSLAVVISQADGARYAAKADPAAVEGALEAIAATARASLADVRALLTELRHSQEPGPQPGMGDIDALVRGFRESGLRIDWTSFGDAVPLPQVPALAVYRITQEALTNALKHGDREQPVRLEFDWSETQLQVTATNAKALTADDERRPATPGHGIPGMRERATLAGGTASIGEGTGGVFRVRAVIPFERADAPTQVWVREHAR